MIRSLDFTGWAPGDAWCVPSAVASVTGVAVADAHRIAAMAGDRGVYEIGGMIDDETRCLMHRLGWAMRSIDLPSRFAGPPRLRDFYPQACEPIETVQPMLIVVADKQRRSCHMIAAQHGLLCDNETARPVPVEAFPRNHRHVVQAWTCAPLT